MLHALSTPDIRLLHVFVTVVESGGFSPAQISLNVAQSTISTQMADLEARLGMRLCNRGRAGFSLTEDGRAVYESAKKLFRSIEHFNTQVNSRHGGLTGALRIAVADALVGNPVFLLDATIERFKTLTSDVIFEMSTANPLEIEQGILEDRYHVGIHTFPSHAPGLVYERLFAEEQTLYCGAKHPLFRTPEDKLVQSDIEEMPFIRRAYYGGTLRTGNFRAKNIGATADSMEASVLLILSGRFIGHLPTGWAEPWVAKGLVRPLLSEQLSYLSQFEVVWRTGAQLTKLVDAFLRELFKIYGLDAPCEPKEAKA